MRPPFGNSALTDPRQTLQTIRRIDELQNQVLEDLDRLNARVENMIECYYQNRVTAGLMPPESLQDADAIDRESAA